MSAEYIILHGPPASGKSLNAAAIKEHYKCDHVFDDGFDDPKIINATGRILILTSNPETTGPQLPRRGYGRRGRLHPYANATKITVKEAAFALGDRWVAPLPNFRKANSSRKANTETHYQKLSHEELQACYAEADRRMKETNGHNYMIILKTRCMHCGASRQRKTRCRGWFATFLDRLGHVMEEKGIIETHKKGSKI